MCSTTELPQHAEGLLAGPAGEGKRGVALDGAARALYTALMTGDGQDKARGGPATGTARSARDARLRAELRQNLARRKARAHALARIEAPPHAAAEALPTPDLKDD